MGNHHLENRGAAEQGDEADEAGASDGASQLIPGLGGPERWKAMMRSVLASYIVASLVTLPSLATRATAEPANAAPDAQAVKAWLNSYSTSINNGDTEALGRLWADGADWAPPDTSLLSGRDAILGFARGTFAKYTVSHRFTSQAFKVVEGLGVAIIAGAERYTPKTGSGVAWGQNVKGVIILRRDEDGLWRGTHFIWNRDAPADH